MKGDRERGDEDAEKKVGVTEEERKRGDKDKSGEETLNINNSGTGTKLYTQPHFVFR
jgi:hypothetical protein